MLKISNPETFRENVKKMFEKILENEKHADNLEKGIYNKTILEKIKVALRTNTIYQLEMMARHFKNDRSLS